MSKLSIITINFNNLGGLKRTVESVVSQTWQEFEYIVIDGGSTDGSAEYIESQSEHIDYWISEPDKGIYNAMNKGIDKATGEYLLFLNSGDCLANELVLEQFINFEPVEDIVYGDSIFIYKDKAPFLKRMPDNLEGMMIFYRTLNHQSVFHKSSIFREGRRYDEEYKMLADWALYNSVVLIEKGTYRHIELTVSNYDVSGFSSNPDNESIMVNDRNVFYAKHIDFFIPLMLKNYEMVLDKHNKLIASKNNTLIFNAYKRIKKVLRFFLRGVNKSNKL